MARNKEGKQPLCPLEYGLDIFNGKWKTRIICLLGASGTLRYKEIRDNLDGLTDPQRHGERPDRRQAPVQRDPAARRILPERKGRLRPQDIAQHLLLGRALLPPAGRIPASLQKGRGLPSVKKQGRSPAPFRICPFPGFF